MEIATPSFSASAEDALMPGSQVGRFVILRMLGQGAMGSVHAAFDPKLNRSVALKRVRPLSDASLGAAAEERLIREARALARLSHPSVVAVHEVTLIEGRVTLAMELVEGTTLEHWLREGDRPPDEVLAVLTQAGEGLAAAHQAGIVHRDFKPSNVLIGADGRARVSDFGLARDRDNAAEAEDEQWPTLAPLHLTRTGELVGTPAYMAPEQLAGQPADARSDQFSFAATLYEALTRVRPYQGETLSHLRERLSRDTAPDSVRRLPPRLRPVLLRALRRDPMGRFGSVRELLDAVARAWSANRAHRGLLAAALGVGVSVAGWGVVTSPARRCEAGSARAQALWTSEARERTERALIATGKPFAATVFASLQGRVEAYLPLWTAHYVTACQEGHRWLSGDLEKLQARLTCLSFDARQLEAVLETVQTGGAPVVERAAQAVGALPSPAHCDEPARERQALGSEAEPARDALARAKSAFDLGRYEAGLPFAVDAQQRAQTLGAQGLLAEATLVRGRLLQRAARYEEARRTYDEALAAAKRGGRRDVEAFAAIELIRLEGDRLSALDEGLAWSARARALLDAYGADPELETKFELATGSILTKVGRSTEAVEHHRRALALAERSGAEDIFRLSAAHQSLSVSLRATGAFEEAMSHAKRAVDLLVPVVGEAHPTAIYALSAVAGLHTDLAEYAQAVPAAAKVVALRSVAQSPVHPSTLADRVGLAVAMAQSGDLEGGIAEQTATLALMRQHLGPRHREVGLGQLNLAEIYRRAGRLAEAKAEALAATEILSSLVSAEREVLRANLITARISRDLGDLPGAKALMLTTVTAAERLFGPEGRFVGDCLTILGQLRLLSRQPALAIVPLERALTIREANMTDPRDMGNTRFYLAQALWDAGGDRRRALQLADLARQTPLRGQIDKGGLEEVERWMKARQ